MGEFGQFCRTTSGGTPSRKNKEYFAGNIPWVKSGELPDGPISEIEEYITGEAVKNSSTKQFPKGTLLIALYGATVGKLGVLTNEAATNQAVCAIFPPEQLETKYLFWYLRFVRSDLIAQAIGGAQPNISQGILRNLLIPVAPLEQQKRIVAEIEKQFSRLDEAVANLKRVKANLKRYKAAVEGKLTEAWRKEHLPAPTSRPGKFYTYAILCEDDSIYIGHTDDIERRWNEHLEGKGAEWTKDHKPIMIAHYEEFDSRQEAADREKWLKTGFGRKWIKREFAAGRTRQAGRVEPASKLLERILTERRAQWKGKGKYKDTPVPDTQNLPTLPNAWTWSSVETLCSDIVDCPHSTPKWKATGRACLRTTEFRPGRLVLTDVRFVSQSTYEKRIQRLKPRENDIVYSREGGILGIACMIPSGVEPCLGQRMMLLRSHALFTPNLLMYWLNSSWTLARVRSLTGGSASPHLNVGEVKLFPVPLAPLAEQEQIVSEVERRLSGVEELEATLEANLTRADRLRQAILQRAFAGQLVHQGLHESAHFSSGLNSKGSTHCHSGMEKY